MSQMSDGVWKIIRSEDCMKSEIAETVQSVYNKLVNPGGIRVGESSVHDEMAVKNRADSPCPIKVSAGEVNDILSDYEPKEPPGFALPHNHDDNNHKKQPKEGLQLPCDIAPMEERKEVPLQSPNIPLPPGFSKDVEHAQPCDGSDEDPDVPPGFGW